MQNIVKSIRSYFFAGAAALIPMIFSLYLIYKFFVWLDSVFPTLTGIDLPFGVGVVSILTFTIVTGMIAKNYIGKKIITLSNALIVSVPVLNKIFLTAQQIMDVFVNPKKNFLGKVVVVEYPKADSWCLGFVTSKETTEISAAIGFKTVSVFVPTAPNPTSGFLIYVEESKAIPVNLTPEMAVKAIVTVGMVSSGKGDVYSNADANLSDLLRKWKQSKNAMKNPSVDPRD